MSKESCGRLLLVFGGIAFIVYLFMMLRSVIPASLYGSTPAANSEARRAIVDEVRASGAALATTFCWGLVGSVQVRGPLMNVEVRPLGIIVAPLFGSSAVRVDQIMRLKYDNHFWRRGLWITHNSRSIASPIFLGGINKE